VCDYGEKTEKKTETVEDIPSEEQKTEEVTITPQKKIDTDIKKLNNVEKSFVKAGAQLKKAKKANRKGEHYSENLNKAQSQYDDLKSQKQQIADEIVQYREQRKQISKDLAQKRKDLAEDNAHKADEREELRREALGLESLDAERKRNALNEIRRANGLAELQYESGNDTKADELKRQDLEAQLQRQREIAENTKMNLELSQKQYSVLANSKDIGYGKGPSNSGVVINNNISTLHPGDPQMLQAISSASNYGNSMGSMANKLYSGKIAGP